jgi:hypothetical protein
VIISPVVVLDVLDIVVVDMVVLPNIVVLVTVVLTVEVTVTLVVVGVVVWVNVTWNETGKLGIVKMQTYPGAVPHDTPLVRWYPETCHSAAGVATIEIEDPTGSWQPVAHEGVSCPCPV